MHSILKKKVFLYLTEFFAGMSVMAVELGASRLLAPYFSSSQIVWTIIIGTIMIAMASGNIYGGRRADKDPNPDRLYIRILIAALWIGLIPVVGKYIILGISAVVIFSVSASYLIWAAFAACMIIFVFPLFLLGTVTPSLAKYTMENLEDNAKTVGTLGAANTAGSIIGTFVPTFITIPAVGTAVTFLIFSGILLALSVIYLISRKVKGRTSIVSLVIFCLSCSLGHSSSFAFWEKDLAYEGESVYNYLQVKELDDRVILSTNVLFGVQSLLMKEEGLSGMFYDYAMAGPLMADVMGKEERGEELFQLILGMGAGTYAKQCGQYFDNSIMEGVEIDSKITALAKEYFKLPEDVKVTTYDGRAYLNAVKQKYDVIMVDAYQDITIPFQMSSIEFFEQVKEHLFENGVLVVNMNMRGQKEGNINQYLSDTISRVFSQVYTVEVPYSTNRILYASDNADMLRVFEENRAETDDSDLSALMGEISANVAEYQAGEYVMTDDSAPVELLGMQVIDELIEEELVWYKKAYEQDGLRGLLESIG